MWILNSTVGRIFDILFLPLRGLNPWVGIILVSLLTSFLMLWIFRFASNQAGILRAKNEIKAGLLELRLYKDNMRISLKAQGRILRANMRYIAYNTKPLLIMIVPLVLILAQLNLRFGYSPLRQGEETLVKIRTDDTLDPIDLAVAVIPSTGITVETPAVRITEEHEISWRIKAIEKGPASLIFEIGSRSVSKSVNVAGKTMSVVSPIKSRGFLPGLLFPGEKPPPTGIPLRAVEILYATQGLEMLGLRVNWIIAYLVLSIVFGFSFRRAFRVEI